MNQSIKSPLDALPQKCGCKLKVKPDA